MKPLVILIPYFGQWPFWFSAFLESCRSNPQVDWVFYTDCGVPENKPNNTRFIELSFDNYKELVSNRLNIPFAPTSAYKLCDIKPLLGYIHANEIANYRFWAFGDVDVVYGNLLQYYAPLMEKYDCISTHVTRISGHLCLLKNSEQMVNAFKRVKGWEEVISKPDHQCFDEKHFTRLFIKHKNWPAPIRRIVDRLNRLRSTSLFHEACTTPNCRLNWHDGTRNFPETWLWNSGQLTNNSDVDIEYPYLHFMYWKGDIWPHIEDKLSLFTCNIKDKKCFSISQLGIHG